jgi:hypothetical protein
MASAVAIAPCWSRIRQSPLKTSGLRSKRWGRSSAKGEALEDKEDCKLRIAKGKLPIVEKPDVSPLIPGPCLGGTKETTMEQKGAWIIAGAIVVGLFGFGFTHLFAQRSDFGSERRLLGGEPGRYQVARASSDVIVILDTATGDLYYAVPSDIKPFSSRPHGEPSTGVRPGPYHPTRPAARPVPPPDAPVKPPEEVVLPKPPE